MQDQGYMTRTGDGVRSRFQCVVFTDLRLFLFGLFHHKDQLPGPLGQHCPTVEGGQLKGVWPSIVIS